eukprot:jgi/Bigna1/71324/fgenesh1_pg.15_\
MNQTVQILREADRRKNGNEGESFPTTINIRRRAQGSASQRAPRYETSSNGEASKNLSSSLQRKPLRISNRSEYIEGLSYRASRRFSSRMYALSSLAGWIVGSAETPKKEEKEVQENGEASPEVNGDTKSGPEASIKASTVQKEEQEKTDVGRLDDIGKQPVMSEEKLSSRPQLPPPPLSEKEKNLAYVLLEYCVPHFPVGVVHRYDLPGVYKRVIEIPKRENDAGFRSPPKKEVFDEKTFKIPVDIAKRLLEADHDLAMLRYKLSKWRVSEMQFWYRYFTELVITVRDYVCRPV